MPSDKQSDTARRNGTKSNVPPRKPTRFRDSLDPALLDELQPTSTIERILIQRMIAAHWRQMRLWTSPRPTAPPSTSPSHSNRTPIRPRSPTEQRPAKPHMTANSPAFWRPSAPSNPFKKCNLTSLTQEVIDNKKKSWKA